MAYKRYKMKKNPTFFDAAVLAVFILCLVFVAGYFLQRFIHSGTRNSIKGLKAPVQHEVDGGTVHMDKGGYDITITFKCSYDIDALVVHTKDYRGDSNMADAISPVDLGLAWGKVAELNETVDFNWDQASRRCYCEINSQEDMYLVGGEDFLNQSFSNNHIIPAEENVKRDVQRIRRGDHVRLRGYLVNVDGVEKKSGQGGYYWYSSTTREDSGDGACEIIYVTNVDWID